MRSKGAVSDRREGIICAQFSCSCSGNVHCAEIFGETLPCVIQMVGFIWVRSFRPELGQADLAWGGVATKDVHPALPHPLIPELLHFGA